MIARDEKQKTIIRARALNAIQEHQFKNRYDVPWGGTVKRLEWSEVSTNILNRAMLGHRHVDLSNPAGGFYEQDQISAIRKRAEDEGFTVLTYLKGSASDPTSTGTLKMLQISW